ncbi:MAG: helix-turn-helix transcriptional regulator [Actinobacteria bacterium]|nr:helix-turn-helix transcriptional regulator [Actinomycetota bacterium]
MSVRNALLGLLGQRPRHGYELHAAFEAVVGGEQIWDVKPAQIYTTLSRLKESGLVVEKALEQEGGPEKRIYEITAEGRQELVDWFAAPITTGHQRDEFFVKLMLSLVTERADPCKLIYTQRASLYKELHDLTTQRGSSDPASELAHIMMLDRAIMHLEADLRWLDMMEARIDEIRRQPVPEPEPRPRGRPRRRPRKER